VKDVLSARRMTLPKSVVSLLWRRTEMIALFLRYFYQTRGMSLNAAASYAVPLGIIGDIGIALLLARLING
jgi:hypothetical protein